MKFEWMETEGEKYPVKIVHKGALREVLLHNLSPAQHATADALHPMPERPGEDDVKDEAIFAAWLKKVQRRNLYFAVLALGPESFNATVIEEQMTELEPSPTGGFAWLAINTIAKAAYDRLSITPDKLEAAKEGVVPFASTPPIPSET